MISVDGLSHLIQLGTNHICDRLKRRQKSSSTSVRGIKKLPHLFYTLIYRYLVYAKVRMQRVLVFVDHFFTSICLTRELEHLIHAITHCNATRGMSRSWTHSIHGNSDVPLNSRNSHFDNDNSRLLVDHL